MDEAAFWNVIQKAHDDADGDMEAKCEAITAAISSLSKGDAITFSHLFDEMMDKAYTWPLWAAAYIIYGGCSDDSFTDFRSSLISRGRQAFERAIANPESLVDEQSDEETLFYEGYEYAVTDGIEASVGYVPERNTPHPDDPSGEAWEEDEVYDLFPRLSAKYA